MPGQAKILSEADIARLLKVARSSWHPLRNAAIIQLSVRAGLRASEIAYLDWAMVTDGRGQISNVMSLPGAIAKYGLARRLPIHAELKKALVRLRCRNAAP
jgi:integrase